MCMQVNDAKELIMGICNKSDPRQIWTFESVKPKKKKEHEM